MPDFHYITSVSDKVTSKARVNGYDDQLKGILSYLWSIDTDFVVNLVNYNNMWQGTNSLLKEYYSLLKLINKLKKTTNFNFF